MMGDDGGAYPGSENGTLGEGNTPRIHGMESNGALTFCCSSLAPSSLNSSRYVLKIFKIVQSLNVFFIYPFFVTSPFECTGTPLAFPSFPVQRAASDTVSSRILRCSTCCKWDSAPKVRVLVLHGASMCFINVLITYCSCNL